MDGNENPVVVLYAAECWQRLRSQVVGRIFMQVGDVLDVFPVNYVVDDESILLRTAEGTKFAELMVSTEVLFEVDDYTDESAWSVVLRGTARRLETEAEIVAAEAATVAADGAHPQAQFCADHGHVAYWPMVCQDRGAHGRRSSALLSGATESASYDL